MQSFRTMWLLVIDGRLHILLAHIFLWVCGMGLLVPHVTVLAANDFASTAAGHRVQCEILADDPDCQHANATAVAWVAWCSFFSNAVFTVWFVPLVGLLSDRYGRKNFMFVGQALTVLPVVWTGLHVLQPSTFLFRFYYVLDAFKGAVNPMSLCIAYAADKIPPEHRAAMFGWQMGTMSLAFVVSAVTGALMGVGPAVALSLVLVTINLALLAFALPESVSEECKARANERGKPLGLLSSLDGIREGFAVITRSTLFIRLALLMAITGMVFECLKDVLFNYLMIKLHFATHEFAKVMAVVGLGSLAVQMGVLPTLLKLLGEKWILVVALACSTVEMGMLAGATNEAMVYASVSVGTLGSMAFPGISALKSNFSEASEQGVVQGALFASKGVAQGIGPLAFSALFHYFTQKEHFMPGAPLIGATVVMAVGFLLALSIHIPGEAERKSNDLAAPLDKLAPIYSSQILADADTQRLLGGSELSDMTGAKSATPLATASPVKSYVIKLQTRSSFSSRSSRDSQR